MHPLAPWNPEHDEPAEAPEDGTQPVGRHEGPVDREVEAPTRRAGRLKGVRPGGPAGGPLWPAPRGPRPRPWTARRRRRRRAAVDPRKSRRMAPDGSW